MDLREYLSLALNEQMAAVLKAWFTYMDRLGNRDGGSAWGVAGASRMYHKHVSDEQFEHDHKMLLEIMASRPPDRILKAKTSNMVRGYLS